MELAPFPPASVWRSRGAVSLPPPPITATTFSPFHSCSKQSREHLLGYQEFLLQPQPVLDVDTQGCPLSLSPCPGRAPHTAWLSVAFFSELVCFTGRIHVVLPPGLMEVAVLKSGCSCLRCLTSSRAVLLLSPKVLTVLVSPLNNPSFSGQN